MSRRIKKTVFAFVAAIISIGSVFFVIPEEVNAACAGTYTVPVCIAEFDWGAPITQTGCHDGTRKVTANCDQNTCVAHAYVTWAEYDCAWNNIAKKCDSKSFEVNYYTNCTSSSSSGGGGGCAGNEECKKPQMCSNANSGGDCTKGNGSEGVCCRIPNNPPSCPATSCTPPACPAGSSPSGGGAFVTQNTCTYNTSTCALLESTRNCYQSYTAQPTVTGVTISGSGGTSSLGCSSATDAIGAEYNNPASISMTMEDPDGYLDIQSALLWFSDAGSAPSAQIDILTTGTGDLQNNSGFGLMIAQQDGNWYAYRPQWTGSTWKWVRGGQIGSGEITRIQGENSDDLAIISNVAVTQLGVNGIEVTMEVEFLHEDSGVTDYERAYENDYTVSAAVLDDSRFLSGGGTISIATPTWTAFGTKIIDLHSPTLENLSYTVTTAEQMSIDWDFADISGLNRVVGNSTIGSVGLTNGPIDDITSGVTGYVLGSAPDKDVNFFDSTGHLWSVDSIDARGDLIDVRQNEGGALIFEVTAFDGACNAGTDTLSVSLGEAWIITKGGVLFSGNGTNLNIREFTEHEAFSTEDYWSGRYSFYRDEADLSTELLSGGGTGLNALIYDIKLGSTRAASYTDYNNRIGYWYNELSNRFKDITEADNTGEYAIATYGATETFSGKVTDIPECSTKYCVIEITGDANFESGYSCDTKAAFLVDGNINIDPDMTNADLTSSCYYIASGNITFNEGVYKSAGSPYPLYDLVEGYFLADGQIIIAEGDFGVVMRDGIKINGSVLGFGNAGNTSVVIERSLKLLQNNNFPVAAIHYDPRYLRIAPEFFGGERNTFKQEVGYKPL